MTADRSRDLSRAFRSPARWALLGACLVGAGLGLAGAGAGAAMVARGDARGALVVLLGLALAGFFGLDWSTLLRPRGRPPASEEVAGGVALPLRRGFHARRAAAFGLLGLVVLAIGGLAGDWTGALLGVAGAALCGWWAVALVREAGAARLRVDPRGVTLPPTREQPSRSVPWGQVRGVATVRGWSPVGVLLVADEREEPAVFRLLPQAWPPEAIRDLVEHYAEHRGSRAELGSAAAVDRFRSG